MGPLFTGAHVPAVRFARALDALDFDAALRDAPPEWAEAVRGLTAKEPERVDGWPEELERAWQRVMGRKLDKRGGSLWGEPAAAFLLRGGDRELADASVRRHLARRPTDVAAWLVLAEFEPVRGFARAAFHSGVAFGLDALAALVDEDGLEDVGRWLLVYAWLRREVAIAEVAAALDAEGVVRPLPLPGPVSFTYYLVEAEGVRRPGVLSSGEGEARRQLKAISEAAFGRYLGRVG